MVVWPRSRGLGKTALEALGLVTVEFKLTAVLHLGKFIADSRLSLTRSMNRG
jgi:hypothetical protein